MVAGVDLSDREKFLDLNGVIVLRSRDQVGAFFGLLVLSVVFRFFDRDQPRRSPLRFLATLFDEQ